LKTDTIFYCLFQSFPQILFELLNLSPSQAQYYRFDSVEIKQRSFRIDGVFLPLVADAPLYFAEVQFQSDPKFYSRFFSEIFLYLDKTDLSNDWQGVVIFPNRRIDNSTTARYTEILNSGRVTRLYLDELGDISQASTGLATVNLIVADAKEAIERGQRLIERVKLEVEAPRQRDLLELIERILVYKLPQISREEIERMFSLDDLRQTKVWQEAKQEGIAEGKQEGKLEAIPRLQALGLTIEQIAEALSLTIEQVSQFVSSDNR
jgi:predicted transposase/invertase (TIGR01784 family)